MAPGPSVEHIVETAETRDQKLREIAERRGIITELDAEQIAWCLPKGQLLSRSKVRWVKINLLALCSPDAVIFQPAGVDAPSDDNLSRFTATLETRCVRDIKREFSWKIYGICCDRTTGTEAHYVRVKFDSANKDRSFEDLTRLLDSLSVNRHVRLGTMPFGISGSVETGAPNSVDRLYMISSCAKQTPHLRKVSVDFEIYLEGEWRRLEHSVDRLGFATYKSTPRSSILLHDGHPDNIYFADDAHLRFARMTLRFGNRDERTMIDIETGEKAMVHVSHTKKTSTIYLPSVRVRTCDGTTVSPARHTMCRLLFRDKDRSPSILRSNNSKHAAADEAVKVATLISKTTRIAAKNNLRIRDNVLDRDILELPIKALVSPNGFRVRREQDKYTFKADLGIMFGQECSLYIVPCHRSHGIILIVQSQDGDYVLRQHVDNPVEFISSITEAGFSGLSHSTLTATRDRKRGSGLGKPYYLFKHDETDAALLVDRLINLLTAIDNKHQTPSRLPLLTKILAHKKRLGGDSPATPRGHGRSNSSASDLSNISELSNNSSLAESDSDDTDDARFNYLRESSDWGIEACIQEISAVREVCEAPGDEIAVELRAAAEGPEAQELPAQVLCRVRKDFVPEEVRELGVSRDEIVVLEYKADPWSFVKSQTSEGWVPTSFLALTA